MQGELHKGSYNWEFRGAGNLRLILEEVLKMFRI